MNQEFDVQTQRPQVSFFCRIRPPTLQELKQYKDKPIRETSKKFHQNYNYSCFANTQKTSVLLTKKCISGQLLESSLTQNQKLLGNDEPACFGFDYCFDESDSLQELYQKNSKPLVEQLFNGISSTVIAYGPSKSGKSFLLRANEGKSKGLLIKSCLKILSKIKNQRDYNMSVEISSVYKENCYDMLSNVNAENLIIGFEKQQQQKELT